MNNDEQSKRMQYEPLLNEIKEYLPVTQYEYLKAHDIALFGAEYFVFNQYYITAINEYICAVGIRKNRPWAKNIESQNPLTLFYQSAISESFNQDVGLYLHELRDNLKRIYEMIDDEVNISTLTEELTNDAHELESNLDYFAYQTARTPHAFKDSYKKNEKTFIGLVDAFLHGGSFDIEYNDISHNQTLTVLNINIPRPIFWRIEKEEGLESFGTAGENSFATFSKLKHEIFILNELIKGTFEYHDYMLYGFRWSIKSTLLFLGLIDNDIYRKMDR